MISFRRNVGTTNTQGMKTLYCVLVSVIIMIVYCFFLLRACVVNSVLS